LRQTAGISCRHRLRLRRCHLGRPYAGRSTDRAWIQPRPEAVDLMVINPIRARRWGSEAAFYFALLLIVLFSLFPFYWVIVTSLKTDAELSLGTHGLWPDHPSLQAFQSLLVTGNFLVPLGNSVLVAAASTAIAVFVGILTAYALVRLAHRARPAVLGFVLAVGFFP